MKALISNYRNIPAEHCGSGAMANLLHFYCDLELAEDVVFGLGAGLDNLYLSLPRQNPSVMLLGRAMTMEANIAKTLGLDYQEHREDDDDKAWAAVKQEVIEGRPTMLSGDIFYLDYREFKVHFPSHRFVLLGFDDKKEQAYIADRIDKEPQACSYGGLRKSRNPPVGISTYNLWGKFHNTEVKNDWGQACAIALEMCCDQMLTRNDEVEAAGVPSIEGAPSMTTGVDAIRKMANSVESWAGEDNAAFQASYMAQCLEKYGNGGGNFRKLYAGFLHWAHSQRPDLVGPGLAEQTLAIAGQWTGLSGTLHLAAKDTANTDLWKQASEQAHSIADKEQALFETIAANF